LTDKKVSRELGMTGEITIRGDVLEIGGLKEKAIAGHRAGLRKILIPLENKKDLVEIPKEVKKDMTFIPVSHYDQVFREVFA
jgi:ATP-dependent Lon protease